MTSGASTRTAGRSDRSCGGARWASARAWRALNVAVLAVALAAACTDAEDQLSAENARLRAELEQLRAVAGPAASSAPSAVEGQPKSESEVVLALQQQVAALRAEVAREQELRLEREREWLRYTESFGALSAQAGVEAPEFEAQVPASERPAPVAPEPVDLAPFERSKDVLRALRALFAIEGVRGLDLLEVGAVQADHAGPVVFRLLDDRGRLAGSLCAQRMRFAGSRSAHTLSIVLEDGYETRGGQRTEFDVDPAQAGERENFGVRRLEFEDIDPLPWLEAAPELFGGVELAAPADDGVWNLTYVRGSLNRLLAVDIERGYFRLKALGGVVEGVLRDVQLDEFDGRGKLLRRLFADRLRIERRERGVALLLEGGASVRGDEKTPFLDGRLRLYLPRADHAEWNRAGLPGLSSRPSDAARAGPDEPVRD